MIQVSERSAKTMVAILFGLSLSALSPQAFAAPNNGGGGAGLTIDDITADGYQCIAQDPKTGNVWCVRGHGEGTYICTPSGQCYPSGPGSQPPWPTIRHTPNLPTKIPGGLNKSR